MPKKMQLTITHLYPDKMNLYGDMGNIVALVTRAELRGIKVLVKQVSLKDKLTAKTTDIYFFGGGQDQEQIEIAQDLVTKKKKALLNDLNNNVPLLSICGGYQLLGKYYLNGDKKRAQGVGFFPIETVAPSTQVKQRCIGNVSTQIINEKTQQEIQDYYPQFSKLKLDKKILNTFVGFENHSGRTRLLSSKKLQLSKVLNGIGDSERQGHEGIRYKNAFGTYMHGSFLPKNPHMTDLILSLALKRKYGRRFKQLSPLDDTIEWQAHKLALKLK